MATGRVAVEGTVIADSTGTRICHLVLESYPPRCGRGLALDGLDLAELPGARTASGVTFAGARIVGELDGSTLRVTAPPQPPRPPSEPHRPTRDLDAPERAALARRYEREVRPLVEGAGADELLEAHLDEQRGYIRVLVIDDRGPLARRLRRDHGDAVDVEGWVTHL